MTKTLRRPRDLIAFVNRVLTDNEGVALPLPARVVTKSEPVYSIERLRALEDEWRSCHPLVKIYLKAIQGLATTNSLASLDENRMFALIYEISELQRDSQDDVERMGGTVYERDKALKIQKLAKVLIATLYKFGVVGVKLSATQGYAFSYEQRATIEDGEIGDDSRFTIHPMLVPALGIHPPNAKAA